MNFSKNGGVTMKQGNRFNILVMLTVIFSLTLLTGCAEMVYLGARGVANTTINAADKIGRSLDQKNANTEKDEFIEFLEFANTNVEVYKKGRLIKLKVFNKDDKERKLIAQGRLISEDYAKLATEEEKLVYVRDYFLKKIRVNLGPTRAEMSKETAIPAPSSLPDIPAPGFAPTPR